MSTLLHLRRKGHPLPATYRPRTCNSSLPSLGVPRPSATGSLPPLAPRPSALHIQAAIALSELGEKRLGDIDRCDIGVQTQPVELSARTKEGSKRSSCSPGRASTTLSYRKKQEAETQTKEQRRKCSTVSSQVGNWHTHLPPPNFSTLRLGLKNLDVHRNVCRCEKVYHCSVSSCVT